MLKASDTSNQDEYLFSSLMTSKLNYKFLNTNLLSQNFNWVRFSVPLVLRKTGADLWFILILILKVFNFKLKP